MRIFLLRHGIAAGHSAGGLRTDSERPLTAEGVEELRGACDRYALHLPTPNRIVSSPLLRARQTAEIVARAVRYTGTIEQSPALVPGARPPSILDDLQGEALTGIESVMLVGHEPHMGSLLGLLVTGSEQVAIPFKTAMLVGVEVQAPRSMLGRLVLCLSPDVAGPH
jgi:phosphohistidine phosphatase